jgi:AsmA protein
MRALKIAGAAIAAVIVVAALLLIVGVPSGFLTSEIQARVERETGYRLTIAGSTRIGVWPSLNVSLSDVTLEAPKDRDNGPRVTVGSVQADITLKSLWAGHPQITALEIVHPVLYAPLLRERDRQASTASKPAKSASEGDANTPTIDRVTITDGAVVFHNLRDRVENRLEAINADVRIGDDRKITVRGSARASDHPLKFEIKATAPVPPIERQNIPVELTFEVPGVLQAPLSARAEARLNGMVVMINGVSGTLGDSAFNGWASVDVASKPLVKLDLDFQRLDVGLAKSSGTSQGTQPPQQSWSNATIDLNGLNYVDAQVRISAAELDIGDARLAPAAIDATLASGLLKASFPNLRAYGGLISGQIAIDASSGNPAYALACDLVGVRALPLLQSAADFDKLDGKMQAKISTRSQGNSPRAISQLSASFRIDKGQATSSDLNLVGPLVKMTGVGTIDLAAKTLAFRVEPKLVMTTEGQGRAADPVGLGIPVVIEGPWAEPRIYPEMAGILDNPDAAYAKLKDMGKGLFGAGGGGLGGLLGGLGGNTPGGNAPGGSGSGSTGTGGSGGQPDQLGKIGETLGNLFGQGFSQGRGIPAPSQGPAAPAAAAPPAAAQSDPPPPQPQSQDSQPMNDVLRQLFNR